jgi:UDP:flavonoid glycosyltransferase YjiC (YdhE family)
VRQVLSEPSYREAAGRIAESFESAGGYERAADEVFAFKQSNGIR